ncbi:MAG: hypothetical protein LBK67_12350 [Coriobacteriales bacterium]|jgi:hypothetical protein|nr:hypothetical protein [Coriobacteriales bacterium]
MTDNAILEKVKQVPDAFSDELSHFVDYLIYKGKRQPDVSPSSHISYDFDSYKLGLPQDVSLAQRLDDVRSKERF